MKIGLFFGSFNPIHNGHLMVASYVANHSDLNQVWLVVSPQNPQKPQSSLLNEYDRLHLAKIGVELERLSDDQADYIGVNVNGPFKKDTYRY